MTSPGSVLQLVGVRYSPDDIIAVEVNEGGVYMLGGLTRRVAELGIGDALRSSRVRSELRFVGPQSSDGRPIITGIHATDSADLFRFDVDDDTAFYLDADDTKTVISGWYSKPLR